VSLKTTAPSSGYTDLAYVRDVPTTVKIDGGFSDWIGKDVKTDTIGDVSNENIDIIRYGTSRSATDLLFYLRVDGEMVGSTAVPFRNTAKATAPFVDSDRDTVPDEDDIHPQDFNNDDTPDVETNHDVDGDGIQDHPYDGDYWLNTTIPNTNDFPQQYRGNFVSIYIGPVEKPEVTGEDTIFIFIDKDNSTNTGCPVDAIGADKLIQIEGKYGEITKKNAYTYNAQTAKWEIDAGIVYAQCDSIQLEVGVSAANLGITGDFSVYFETSDWKGEKDKSGDYITLGFSRSTRGGTRSPGSATSLTCYVLTKAVAVDGDYSASEWDDADNYTIAGENKVFTKRDDTYAYFCAIALFDSSKNHDDRVAFYWDRAHDGGGVPDADDIRYRTNYSSSLLTWISDVYNGTVAGGWTSGTAPGTAQIAGDYDSSEGYMVYECRMPLSTLNEGGNFDVDGEIIGYAVITRDGSTYTSQAWPDAAADDTPGGWGDLTYSDQAIPEFPTTAIPIFGTIILFVAVRYRIKRREYKKENI
jgi:hypothetical protein